MTPKLPSPFTVTTGSSTDNRDSLTHSIIGCAIRVHRELGPGLLESAYDECLCYELIKNRLAIRRHVSLPLFYDGVRIEVGFRPDIIVNDKVILELKTVTTLLPIHNAQLLTYLRLSGIPTGLLLNFHAHPLMTGIKRLIQSPSAQGSPGSPQ